MSVWFCSRRAVVAALSGRFASALTIKRRVHVMWSSHSLRMALLKSSCVIFWFCGFAVANAGAENASIIAPAKNAASTRPKILLLVRFIMTPFTDKLAPSGLNHRVGRSQAGYSLCALKAPSQFHYGTDGREQISGSRVSKGLWRTRTKGFDIVFFLRRDKNPLLVSERPHRVNPCCAIRRHRSCQQRYSHQQN